MIWTTLGGIGLFLLGMSLMTDGLKAVAGGALRQILGRYVSSPLSGVGWGAALTVLVQSSHATTMTTIGFVSAGLLTFSQAVGVVLGANLGTTSTGWLVSLLGFKVSVGAYALPLIFVAAMMRLFGRGKVANYGLALGGFGLLFVGIATLQTGMAGLAERISPADLPQPTVLGRLGLVGIGLLMTVVMQSSSAAVATTLAAMHAGAVELDQAAALVIGQNIGSAVTSGIAAIGGSTAAKRTAWAHVMFNVVAAGVAVVGLSVFARGAEWINTHAGENGDALALAAFHTVFNVVGILLVLPVLGRFSRLIERLVPERRSSMLAHLDPRIADAPMVAAAAARSSLFEASAIIAEVSEAKIAGRGSIAERRVPEVERVLAESSHFLVRSAGSISSAEERAASVAVHHSIDHLGRWIETLGDAPSGAAPQLEREDAGALRREIAACMKSIAAWGRGEGSIDVEVVAGLSRRMAEYRKEARASILERTATGLAAPEQASHWIDELKWLDRLMYHAWRVVSHLQLDGSRQGASTPEVHVESDAHRERPA